MPSTEQRAPAGLECWLTGTRGELHAALAALDRHFVLVNVSALEPLPPGRYRRYVRAQVRSPALRAELLRPEPGRDSPEPFDQEHLFEQPAVATAGPALSTPRQSGEDSA